MGAGLTELRTLVSWPAVAFAVSAVAAMVLIWLVPRRYWRVVLVVLWPLLALWPVVLAWINRLEPFTAA